MALVFKALDRAGAALFLLTVLIYAPLFGGGGFLALFAFRALTLTAFIFYITRICLFKSEFFHEDRKAVNRSLFLISFFLLYVFIQWVGGHHVFAKVVPGSIVAYSTADFLVQLIVYLLFFFLCLDFFSSRKRINLFIVLIAIQTAFLIAVGYFYKFSDPSLAKLMYGFIPVAPGFEAFFASFVNPNHYGGYLVGTSVFFLASVIYYFESSNYRFKIETELIKNIAFLFLFLLATASIFHSESRAAFFSQALIIFLLGVFASQAKYRLQAFFAISSLAFTYILFVKFLPLQLPFEKFIKNSWHVLLGRFDISNQFLPIFLDFPFFGTGLGTFKYISSQYQKILVDDLFYSHPINHHLELLTNTGLLGYFLFMTPLFFLIVTSFRKSQAHSSYWHRVYGLASFISIFFFAVPLSLMDDYLKTPAIAMVFVINLAILVKCAGSEFSEESETREGGAIDFVFGLRRLLVLTFFIAISLTLSLIVSRHYTGGRLIYAFDQKVNAGIINIGFSDSLRLEKSVSIVPDNPESWLKLGEAYFHEATKMGGRDYPKRIANSIRAYEMATKLAPTWPEAWMGLGRVKIFAGKRADGLEDMSRGVKLSPRYRDRHLYLILEYSKAYEISRSEKEKEAFKKEAMKWLGKASKLERPLTADDFDFIGGYYHQRLSKDDQHRILALLTEINETKQ